MDSHIARQPIFNKDLSIFAYELLFRSGESSREYSGIDGNQASSHTIVESFHTIGLDNITGRKIAFINFTEELLLRNIATLFPKELLVIEILETVTPTQEIISACKELYNLGYTLALDDFVYYPALDPLINLSKIIKFDFMASSPSEISEMLRRCDFTGKRLLAEKIETPEMFERAQSMGFSLFQGYFFSKPVTLKSKKLVPLNMNYHKLLQEVDSGGEMDFEKMSDIIRKDIALCQKLLKLVNSAYYSHRKEITDIKHALAVLGTKEIRKWIYLITLMQMCADKPDELIRMALIRGYFMEEMTKNCETSKRPAKRPEIAFLTGMFSLIDTLMGQPMEVALADMALPSEVMVPLFKKNGRLYDLLMLVVSLEKGMWSEADNLAASFGVGAGQVSDTYLSAIEKCDSSLA